MTNVNNKVNPEIKEEVLAALYASILFPSDDLTAEIDE